MLTRTGTTVTNNNEEGSDGADRTSNELKQINYDR